MHDFLKTFWQYLVPQHALSSLMHRFANIEWAPLKNLVITSFCRLYQVDLSQAERKTAQDYQSFNDFFTRKLAVDARIIDTDPHQFVSPVDGRLSQWGNISGEQLIQAKGMNYTTSALLGGNIALADRFRDGQFSVIYLSPRDYHRIHIPIDATLVSMMYVPGKLFAVNQATVRTVPELFARNERLVIEFDTAIGRMVLVMVGAIFVGSMETVWEGMITPPYDHTLTYWDYRNDHFSFKKGDEIGRFNMGSTVVLLTEGTQLTRTAGIELDAALQMGQALASIQPAVPSFFNTH